MRCALWGWGRDWPRVHIDTPEISGNAWAARPTRSGACATGLPTSTCSALSDDGNSCPLAGLAERQGCRRLARTSRRLPHRAASLPSGRCSRPMSRRRVPSCGDRQWRDVSPDCPQYGPGIDIDPKGEDNQRHPEGEQPVPCERPCFEERHHRAGNLQQTSPDIEVADPAPPAYPNQTLIDFNITFNAGGRGIHIFRSEYVTVANNS